MISDDTVITLACMPITPRLPPPRVVGSPRLRRHGAPALRPGGWECWSCCEDPVASRDMPGDLDGLGGSPLHAYIDWLDRNALIHTGVNF